MNELAPRTQAPPPGPDGQVITVCLPPSEEWTNICVVGESPETGAPDDRRVVRIRHTNAESITLTVHEDGAVTFDGDAADYPADGWRVSWLDWSDAVAMIEPPEPTDALAGHGLNQTPPIMPATLAAPLV